MALEDIAGYSLRRGLGSGAAGSVWLLRDLGSGRHAVLKRISAALVPAVEEFRRDLALTRSIDCPHLARLFDVRQTDREWLLISQYVAAGTLRSLLERREPLSLGELVTLISPLAQALATLHRAGLAHGSVSLDNIMFDAEGRPVLTDVGLRVLTSPTPQPAAKDLTALADIAQLSGGDPRIFTPELFTGDGDEIARRVLRLAAPDPINLGFGDDPPTSTPPPSPAGTTNSPPARAEVVESQESGHPEPSGASVGPAAEVNATASGALSASTADPADQLPGGTGNPWVPVPPTLRESAVAGAKAGSRKATGSRRTKGRATRSRGRNRRRRPSHGFSIHLTSKVPAYGVLVMAGLGALIVLAFGLVTVGVLGGPSSTAASAAGNQPKTSGIPTTADTNPDTPSPAPASSGGAESGTTPTTPVNPSAPTETTRWLKTLQTLDAQRSRTFWTLDDAGLDAFYVPGTSPWKSDKSLLASYRSQQLRIEGLEVQIQSLTVERSSANSAILHVVDRLASATAVDKAGHRTPLPAGQPTSRRITLRIMPPATTWRITEITTP